MLVSVRDCDEARIAFDAGADVIDVKEPRNGPLGRADRSVITAIARDPRLTAAVPLTAALGELAQIEDNAQDWNWLTGLSLVKVGLANRRSDPDWRDRLDALAEAIRASFGNRSDDTTFRLPLPAAGRTTVAPAVVPTAYADAERADAPNADAVLEYAIQRRSPFLLIDTHTKDGRSIADWLPPPRLSRIARKCHDNDIGLTLAGSIRAELLAVVAEYRPRVIAVRGAVCRAGDRDGRIDAERVRRFRARLDEIFDGRSD